MANIGNGRVLRVCDLCGGVDDHPRHVIAGSVNGTFDAPKPDILAKVAKAVPDEDRDRLLTALLDTGSQDRHMDCCRDVGCPDGSCDQLTVGAEKLRGARLLEHLIGKDS